MALILNIETSTVNCSVSLSSGGETLVIKEQADQGYSHGEMLHVFIEEVINKSGFSKHQLDAIAVSKGPGSYTGLRIGVSAAKGLCYALDKPLISIPTLEALAHQVRVEKGAIISLLDARRLEVYSAIFSHDHQLIRKVKAEVLTPDLYRDYIPEHGQLHIVGNAIDKTKELLDIPEEKVRYISGLPSSREMGSIAEAKYQKSDMEDVAYFEPYYLKDFIAIKPKPLF